MYENKSNSVSDGMRIAGSDRVRNHATLITARDVVSGDPAGPIASEIGRLHDKASALIDLAAQLHGRFDSVLYPAGVEASPSEGAATAITCKHHDELFTVGSRLEAVRESLSNLLKRCAL